MDINVTKDDLPPVPEAPRQRGRPKGTGKKKMNDIEKIEFINESIKVILKNHYSYNEYITYCRVEKDMSRPQANEYWLRVWSLLKKKFEMDKDKLISKHIMKYWEIHEQATENKDWTNARQALNDLAKLQGLNEPEKVHITGTSIKLNFGEPSE